jgi:hypothetical protein
MTTEQANEPTWITEATDAYKCGIEAETLRRREKAQSKLESALEAYFGHSNFPICWFEDTRGLKEEPYVVVDGYMFIAREEIVRYNCPGENEYASRLKRISEECPDCDGFLFSYPIEDQEEMGSALNGQFWDCIHEHWYTPDSTKRPAPPKQEPEPVTVDAIRACIKEELTAILTEEAEVC